MYCIVFSYNKLYHKKWNVSKGRHRLLQKEAMGENQDKNHWLYWPVHIHWNPSTVHTLLAYILNYKYSDVCKTQNMNCTYYIAIVWLCVVDGSVPLLAYYHGTTFPPDDKKVRV